MERERDVSNETRGTMAGRKPRVDLGERRSGKDVDGGREGERYLSLHASNGEATDGSDRGVREAVVT
nr:hypothetical protein CFP56_03920 [Quercus suber]